MKGEALKTGSLFVICACETEQREEKTIEKKARKRKEFDYMRKRILAIVCIAAILGLGGVMAASAGARRIIRVENGERVVTELESSSEKEPGYAAENESETAAVEPVKLWGTMNEVIDGSLSINRQLEDGTQEEVILHINPEQTLVLDGVNGFPADLSAVSAGEPVYAYAGPAMTMSIPPQMNAVMVLVNVPQDGAAPEYVTAAAALTEDGQGGYCLKTAGGAEIAVPADCEIIPYLTRQIVRLSDIAEGSRCLVWMGADGAAEKIVLFHE